MVKVIVLFRIHAVWEMLRGKLNFFLCAFLISQLKDEPVIHSKDGLPTQVFSLTKKRRTLGSLRTKYESHLINA